MDIFKTFHTYGKVNTTSVNKNSVYGIVYLENGKEYLLLGKSTNGLVGGFLDGYNEYFSKRITNPRWGFNIHLDENKFHGDMPIESAMLYFIKLMLTDFNSDFNQSEVTPGRTKDHYIYEWNKEMMEILHGDNILGNLIETISSMSLFDSVSRVLLNSIREITNIDNDETSDGNIFPIIEELDLMRRYQIAETTNRLLNTNVKCLIPKETEITCIYKMGNK